jgi:hypothetical protein
MRFKGGITFHIADLFETDIQLVAVITKHRDHNLLAHADVVADTTPPSDIDFGCGEHDIVVSIRGEDTIYSGIGDTFNGGDH